MPAAGEGHALTLGWLRLVCAAGQVPGSAATLRAVVALLYSVSTVAALRVCSGVGLGGALQLAPQPVLRDVRDLGKRHALEGTAGSPAVDPVRLAT